MIIRWLYTAWARLGFRQQDDPLACQRRGLLTEQGRFPSRRPWERRLKALPVSLPGLIGCLGRYWVGVLQPWAHPGHGVALDSPRRMGRAKPIVPRWDVLMGFGYRLYPSYNYYNYNGKVLRAA
jgi:hypothetical protein